MKPGGEPGVRMPRWNQLTAVVGTFRQAEACSQQAGNDVIDLNGQSWGGNVVLTLAARYGGVAAIALVDGGWIHLAERYPTFEDCWAELAPPAFDHLTRDELTSRIRGWYPHWPEQAHRAVLACFADQPDGTVLPHLTRDHHRAILSSLFADDPHDCYGAVAVPALLMPAVEAIPVEATAATRALDAIPGAAVSWYVGADHDIHAQLPDRCAADLLVLAARVIA